MVHRPGPDPCPSCHRCQGKRISNIFQYHLFLVLNYFISVFIYTLNKQLSFIVLYCFLKVDQTPTFSEGTLSL